MKRRLFRAVAVVSLLAGVVILVMSARSYRTRDNLWWCGEASGRLWWVESVEGQLAVRTAAPWPVAVGTRWTTAPAAADMYLVTAEGLRPLIRVSLLNQPPDPDGFYTRGWENTRWLTRVRHGPSRTTRWGMHTESPLTIRAPVPLQLYEVVVPHWMAALVAALPGIGWGLGFLPPIARKNRARRGLCAGCGYDLTGNVSGVCPECGRATGAASGAASGAAAGRSISASAGDTVETAVARPTGTNP